MYPYYSSIGEYLFQQNDKHLKKAAMFATSGRLNVAKPSAIVVECSWELRKAQVCGCKLIGKTWQNGKTYQKCTVAHLPVGIPWILHLRSCESRWIWRGPISRGLTICGSHFALNVRDNQCAHQAHLICKIRCIPLAYGVWTKDL